MTIINNSNKSIHGSQLGFYHESNYLEIVDNKLASEKLKSKKFPTAVYIVPIFIVGYVIYAGLISLLDSEDEFTVEEIPLPEKSEDAINPLYNANIIQKELYHFNIAKQVLHPGKHISGFIAFKSKTEINDLNIQVREVDYKVLGIY